MDFKERFKGRTAHIGKDGHIGIVLNASNPIQDLEANNIPASHKYSDRNKRAISQNYSFNTELNQVDLKSGLKRRKHTK